MILTKKNVQNNINNHRSLIMSGDHIPRIQKSWQAQHIHWNPPDSLFNILCNSPHNRDPSLKKTNAALTFDGLPSHFKVFLKHWIKVIIRENQPIILNSHIQDMQWVYNVFSWDVLSDFIFPFAVFDNVGLEHFNVLLHLWD